MDVKPEAATTAPDKLLLNIERLTDLTMNKLIEGSADKLLTTSQHRLLTILVLRCIKLWRELRDEQPGLKPPEREFEQLEAPEKNQE